MGGSIFKVRLITEITDWEQKKGPRRCELLQVPLRLNELSFKGQFHQFDPLKCVHWS